MLHKNIYAIRKINPILARRITLPVHSDHIVKKDKKIGYRLHETVYPLQLSTKKIQRFRRVAPQKSEVLLWGCALGDLLDVLLEKGNRVVVWERDPWLLRMLLQRRYFGDFLERGQLQILLGADIVTERERLSTWKQISHPFFATLYRFERSLVQGPHKPIGMLCRGELFIDDVSEILLEMGYALYIWDVEHMSHDEVLYAVVNVKPTFCITINYRYGLAEIVERMQIPLLVWEIDPAMDEIRPTQSTTSHTHIFTWNPKHVARYREAGFQNGYYLPLATNEKRCFPKASRDNISKRFHADVSFVGATLHQSGEHYRDVFLDAYVRWSQKDDGKEKFDALITEQAKDWSHFYVSQLLQTFFPNFYASMQQGDISLEALLGEYLAYQKRRAYVESLDIYDAAIWGDRSWRLCTKNYRGYAGHRLEVVDIYRASHINIDINRIYQPDIVTMRVFDVIASGGFVLAEYSTTLDELFVLGTEIETYRTLDELHEKINYYLCHPQQRRKIVEAGRKKVTAEHTMKRRLHHMLSYISL